MMKLTIEITVGHNVDGAESYVFTLTDTNGKTTVGDAFGGSVKLADAIAAAIKVHLSPDSPGNRDTAYPPEPWLP
jgi:hypothetical protein